MTDQRLTGYGFGRNLRLLTASDYKAVFSQAEFKVSCPQLLILATRHDNVSPRLGLVIAKKNIRLAVQRNRVKRLIRESFRHQQDSFTGLDIVILARKGLGTMDNAAIARLLDKLWQDLVRRRDRQFEQKAAQQTINRTVK
ncbi:MAG: ribonuclease P protein component [Pseudohongiella sp.]|uniref:ribonuclease P protein component n=1 Tax=Pseudohongiella sp. TaxID=1979412 RepID=UPI0034A016AF